MYTFFVKFTAQKYHVYPVTSKQIYKTCKYNSAGSRISRTGAVDLVGGGMDSRGGYVSKILCVKTKESGPLGVVRRARPLDPPVYKHHQSETEATNLLKVIFCTNNYVQQTIPDTKHFIHLASF